MTNQELLKIYSSYLPYKTPIMAKTDKGWIRSPIHNLSHGTGIGTISHIMTTDRFKLGLRPLSDLVNEIEHNGEKFVPLYYLYSELYPIDYFEDTYHYDYLLSWIKSKDKSHHVKFLPYGLIKQLQEWHFDTEELLDKNLAINLNEVK